MADLIREKPVREAENILAFTRKGAAVPLLKLLRQALANAKNNFHLEDKSFYISKILVDEGPKLKRIRQRARGHADEIQKKTSHITIVIDELKGDLEKKRAGAKGRRVAAKNKKLVKGK